MRGVEKGVEALVGAGERTSAPAALRHGVRPHCERAGVCGLAQHSHAAPRGRGWLLFCSGTQTWRFGLLGLGIRPQIGRSTVAQHVPCSAAPLPFSACVLIDWSERDARAALCARRCALHCCARRAPPHGQRIAASDGPRTHSLHRHHAHALRRRHHRRNGCSRTRRGVCARLARTSAVLQCSQIWRQRDIRSVQ